MATRGRRRPRFEPSIATRGRRRTQRANSAQGAGRPRITTPSQNRKKGRGWHTNREGWRAILVSHLAISCRDPNRFEPAIAPRGSRGRGDYRGDGVRCVVVVLLCCAALLCCHCPAPSSGYNTELLHRWVDTLSSNPTVTTPSCYCAVLHCCAALLCCTAVLHCCVLSGGLFELQPSCYLVVDTLSSNPTVTTPSCHPVVRPHSQHRKVALRGTEVTSQRSKPGH
jgi:hypothetical protein